EVAERLDAAGEKMRRGFLDWLAVRGEAARPARMPVVFKLADAAREAVLASEPVRLQADAGGTPVVFETETDVRVVPGRLDVIVGVDAEKDEFYLPSPGLSDLQPREPMPTQWQLKSFASAGATTVQLDPDSGLSPEMNIETGGEQYRIIQADKGIVTIDPGLAHDLPAQTTLRQVTTFTPFENGARNRQEHSLSLGHMDLLNVEAAATIEIVGATGLSNMSWQYWGKVDPNDEVGWQPLTPAVNQPAKNAVLLTKPKGAVEPIEVDGKNSRWIRALTKTVGASQQPFMTDELSIRVNAEGCDSKMPCPPKVPIASPTAEAMANTTPLVLDSAFFPVGKEPRQFDAFYLGSQEAFSKKGAKVQLCFEMADRTFSALAAVREGTFANLVLAGVAKDRTLHLHSFNPTTGVIGKFRERDSLLPPLPGYLGNAEAGNAVALDEQPRWRLPVWSESDFPPFAGLLVGVSAGDAIWVWHEHSIFQKSSGWIDFGTLPSIGSATTAVVDGLVYLSGISPTIAALRDGHLFLRDWPNGAQWNEVDTVQGSNDVTLTSIVPVLVENHSGQLVTSAAAGMLGISDNKKLFHVTTAGVCTPVLSAFDFDTEIRPVAIEVGGDRIVAAVTESDPPELVAHHDTAGTEQVTLDNDTEVLAALEAVLIGGTFHVLATIRDGAGGRLATWAPFAAGLEASLFESPVAEGGGLVEGAPIAVNRFVVIPGARADILISEFDPSVRLVKSADVETGVVVPDSIPALAVNDLMVRLDAGEPVSRAITQAGLTKDEEVFYPIASDFRSGTTGLDAYKLSATFTGTFADPDLTLDSADHETAEGDWLWIDGEFYEVD
ncbi:MAG TPA: hypothetical protein VFI12_01755, partial [Thermomicrobiales bacterium]|nr:hypothetical protein [Thermomicrobiales bacterium]